MALSTRFQHETNDVSLARGGSTKATPSRPFTCSYRASLLASICILAACGSGGGAGEQSSQTATPAGDTSPSDDATSSSPASTDSTASFMMLANDNVITGSLGVDESTIFLVPGDSQIVLESTRGDNDLFLFNSLDFSLDTLLCADASPFRQDTCSGDVSGDVYAAIYSQNAGDYRLSVTNNCSVENVNDWVYRNMQDYYLFTDQVPVVNPSDYDSPNALIRDLRFNEADPFSSVREAMTQQVLFEEGREFGFGYRWARDAEGLLRVLTIHNDSPFGRAGVKRGDIFESLGGIPDTELNSEIFFDLIGTAENPLPVAWTFIDGETGERKSFTAQQSDYTVNTVAFVDVFTNPSFNGRIGYIVFNQFLETSTAELDAAIRTLQDADVTELILDLRYNGGGRVSVSQNLAAQLSNNRLTGEVFSREQYNDNYRHLDNNTLFAPSAPTLDLSRVIVLTTESTASASELLINSLSAYMDVVTIGESSTGKSLQSRARNFCGYSMNAMDSQLVNANDNSVVGGISATCFATDDSTRDFGVTAAGVEGMLSTAFDYVLTGACNPAPSTVLASRRDRTTTAARWEETGNISVDDVNIAPVLPDWLR